MGSVSKRITNNVQARRMAIAAGLTLPLLTLGRHVLRGSRMHEYRFSMLRTFRKHRRDEVLAKAALNKRSRASREFRRLQRRAEREQKQLENPALREIHDMPKRGYFDNLVQRGKDAFRRFRANSR